MTEKLFVAGASARSIAQSANRIGLQVEAADLFCDRDLEACGMAHRVKNYPSGIVAISKKVSPRDWLFTGGLENSPHLVDAISERHRLLGSPGEVIRRVRDPWTLQSALRRGGLLSPDLSQKPCVGPTLGWLAKPRGSCGGSGVIRWHADADNGMGNGPTYLQEFIGGRSFGAVYVGASGSSRLIGVTRQLVGRHWGSPETFTYTGSIGPIRLDAKTVNEFSRIGDCIAAEFGLVGLFGVDAIHNESGVWTVEVNPRYTASVEVHERAAKWSAIQAHIEACREQKLPSREFASSIFYGKLIVFADQPTTASDRFNDWIDNHNSQAGDVTFADLPSTGTRFSTRAPVVTVLAHGPSLRDVCHRLKHGAQQVRRALIAPP